MRIADVICIFAVLLFSLHALPMAIVSKLHVSTENSFYAGMLFWEIGALVGLISTGKTLRKAFYTFALLLPPAVILYGILTTTLA